MSEEEASPAEEVRPAGRRVVCGKCLRPGRVCLCAFFPPDGPIDTSRGTRVVILQHPMEAKKALATARLAPHVIRRASVITGRRLRRSTVPTDSAREAVFRALDEGTLWVVFPGAGAAPFSEREVEESGTSLAASQEESKGGGVTLLLLDGTWKQGKEMFTALYEDKHDGEAFRRAPLVYLSPQCLQRPLEDAGLLRKEPAPGCVSTLEAVAEALFHIEGRDDAAAKVREAIIRVYDALVGFQRDRGAPHLVRREKDARRDIGKAGV